MAKILSPLATELSRPEYAKQLSNRDYTSLELQINDPVIEVVQPGSYLTELGVLAVLGPVDGEAFLGGIETAATGSPVLNRAIRWLRSERGIDIGNAHVRVMLSQLRQAKVVTLAATTAILAVGTRVISRAEELGLGYVGLGLLHNAIKEIEAA